jgi:catechol 2,3-dioxygenase-like lactoylglutathione lyase family enzyme
MMSITKAWDVAYVRFSAPDLDSMRTFLGDFGMIEVESSAERLIMRGYGTAPYVHITELGEPGFAGFGIEVPTLDDLHKLARYDNVDVQPIHAPGGGQIVRLCDPDGFVVEVVAGRVASDPVPSDKALPWNHGGNYARQSQPRRVSLAPSKVQRLGHVVLNVSDFRASEAWYKERFGFISSDEIQPAPGHGIGAFMRADRGDVPCDHHTLFLLDAPGPVPSGFMHSAFEVADLDDLMTGHDHLAAKGYDHQWGIGRHVLGSQVFDYWRDPFGNEIEHWTDGDQFTAADGGGVAGLDALLGVQWGMKMPPVPGMVSPPPGAPDLALATTENCPLG